MASDMMVALARATLDGHTFFGHNSNRLRGEGPSLVRAPARAFAPGEMVQLPWAHLPQPRHTWAVLAGRAAADWGYQHGVNEKGVAVGYTPIRTRLEAEAPGLTGPDLVRLALERATSACQAVEVLTDLIGRYGQGAFGGVGSDSAFLVSDCREACVLEAAGRHWVLAEVRSVRAVNGACLLRQDWDRISRGLSDLAISHGWWPADGRKLDFAGALGEPGADQAGDLRRWGQATLWLEQHSGHLEAAFLRELLREQGDLLAPGDDGELQTAASLLVRLGPRPGDLPVSWYAFASPSGSVFFPVSVAADPPAAFTGEDGAGSPLWRTLSEWQAESRRDPRFAAALHAGLAGLQERLDEHLHEFLPEANELHHGGNVEQLRRLAGSFLQHCLERFEELAVSLHPRPAASAAAPEEDLIEAW
jgi:hypothetical protein